MGNTLDLYDQRLKAEAAVQLKEVGVCKDVSGIIIEYVCSPDREMLVDGGYTLAGIIHDLSANARLVVLLPDFIQCFRSIHAPDGHTFTDPGIVPSVADVAAARYACFGPNAYPWMFSPITNGWTSSPLRAAIKGALMEQSMYLFASLMIDNAKRVIPASDIFDGIFRDFTVEKQRKSAAAFPFFVKALCRWSNNWSQFDMDDAIALVGRHTDNRTAQKNKAWELFQHVTPVKKAAWVAVHRENKTHGASYFAGRWAIAISDAKSLVKMIKEFTVETAAEWPKLKEKKAEKRKACSTKSGKGKKAKKQFDEFGVETSDGEYQ
jgi:hypothetical protein